MSICLITRDVGAPSNFILGQSFMVYQNQKSTCTMKLNTDKKKNQQLNFLRRAKSFIILKKMA